MMQNCIIDCLSQAFSENRLIGKMLLCMSAKIMICFQGLLKVSLRFQSEMSKEHVHFYRKQMNVNLPMFYVFVFACIVAVWK